MFSINLYDCFVTDHASFRDWLRIEVLWSIIENAGKNIYKTLSHIHIHIEPGESFTTFLKVAKQQHRQEVFAYELGVMKSQRKGAVAKTQRVLKNAGQRCLCR